MSTLLVKTVSSVSFLSSFFRCSDNCLVDKKMVQSSTADALKKVLQGVSAHIQANDADELEYNEIAREVARKK